MCFSAEASFIAAAVVGTVGCATVKQVRRKAEIPLAILPVLFAFQQLCEGVLWVFLTNHLQPNLLFTAAEYAYVAFAFMLWPTLFSLSALVLESEPWRRRILASSLIIGLCVSLYFVWYFTIYGTQLAIVGNSIRYSSTHYVEGFFYLAALSIPFIFSSVRYLWVMGVFAPISFAISGWFYWANFASVWCFFAAFISIWIYFVMRTLREESEGPQVAPARVRRKENNR